MNQRPSFRSPASSASKVRESPTAVPACVGECFSTRSKLSSFVAIILLVIINVELYQLGWYNVDVRHVFRLPPSAEQTSPDYDLEDGESSFVPYRKTQIDARMIDELVKRENFVQAARNYSGKILESRNKASLKVADLILSDSRSKPKLKTQTTTKQPDKRKRPRPSKGDSRTVTLAPTTSPPGSTEHAVLESVNETRHFAANLLNRANNAFLVNEADRCSPDRLGYEIETIVIMTSRAENIDRRIAARSTWLSEHWRTRLRVAHVFLLGMPVTTNRELERRVAAESATYRDILINSEFTDSYSNLARKSVAMLKWVSFFCSHARYVVKADDDTFVNLARLVPILRQVAQPNFANDHNPFLSSSDAPAPEGKDKEDTTGDTLRDDAEYKLLSGQAAYPEAFIIGGLFYGGTPHRDPVSKWFVPESEYPANEYPPFAFGIGYAMSVEAAQRLYVAALRDSVPFRLEDVYITGILAERAGVQRIAQAGFFNYLYEPMELCTYNRNVITSHYVTPRILEDLWRQFIAHETENYRPDCAPLV